MLNSIKSFILLFFLIGLSVFALYELASRGSIRRTLVFYTIGDDIPVVEERMLPRLSGEELEIQRYVEEALLGPVAPKTAALFAGETRLLSCMYRNGVVYVGLSEFAALPPVEDAPLREGEVLRGLQTLEAGIRRNFAAVQAVKIFINGNQIAS